jgi:hypothetical protein
VIVDDKLYLKIWMITCSQVRIADIVLVKRSYNPLSSPAASLKRLCLYCKKYLGTVNQICFLISPVREQEFLDILKSINPDIDIQVTEKQGKWRFWDWDL